jgi:chaperonin cofactor prefoldin
MDILGTVINALVVAAVGYVVIRVGNGRFEDLKERFEDLIARVDRLEDRLDKRIDAVQSSVEALRSDVTAIALAVGARTRPPQAESQ